MFFLITIVATSVVFRIIIHFIRDLLNQTNDIIATISLLNRSRCFMRFYAFSARLSSLLRELKSLLFKKF